MEDKKRTGGDGQDRENGECRTRRLTVDDGQEREKENRGQEDNL